MKNNGRKIGWLSATTILIGLVISLNPTNTSLAGRDLARVMVIEEARSALINLQDEFPRLRIYNEGTFPTRLYGQSFAFGNSPKDAAERFITDHCAVFGVDAVDLAPVSLLADSRHTQPIMYNRETGEYKFTLVYYSQNRDGLPVFRSELRLLVRNEPGFPVVLAVSSLRNLGDFGVGQARLGGFSAPAEQAARAEVSGLTDFTEQEPVIWAGTEDKDSPPRLALKFEGGSAFPQRWLFVADAETGEILHAEDRIIFEDVTGNVSGLATQGTGAEHCEPEVTEGLPYARVTIGGTTAYADINGDYLIPNGGTSEVTVGSQVRGEWFRVYNYTGSESILNQTVSPPGPADFLHNPTNTESIRSQVNAYIEANVIRDLVLSANPSYPALDQNEFSIYVNRTDGYCPGNAWYSSWNTSINFCSSGGSSPNTGWGTVVHHEYGHHLVEMAGSGQGQYGEGMGDVMGILVTDESGTGYGFSGNCNQPLREANNTFQYPCAGEIHYCGKLISGCTWSTRNELLASYPGEYRQILTDLAVNSMLLHTGSLITPQITIDWLTLDDDDANLHNGTPHYPEICAGFGAHNMDCPEVLDLVFSYPDGRPWLVSPNKDTTVRFSVAAGSYNPVSGSGAAYYSIDGAPYQAATITQLGAHEYRVTIPAVGCDNLLEWYVTAEAEGFTTVPDPRGAPTESWPVAPVSDQVVVFTDDFETDKSWTVTNSLWTRGVPIGVGGEYGGPDPTSGHNAPKVYGYNLLGDYANDIPERHLTSPAFDCSGLTGVHLNFWRWLGVEQPAYDHAYIRASNDGSNWTTVWENTGEITDYSWVEMEVDLSSVADDQSTVYLRWTMGSTDGGWRYCGWNLDDVEVAGWVCNDAGADSDEDGVTNEVDNCPYTANPLQEDSDSDGVGDVCDNCEFASNPQQFDADVDGDGDSCDVCTDTDNDTYGNPGYPQNTCPDDNCPTVANPGQENFDGDAFGDACDLDDDNDGVDDLIDNCPFADNPGQENNDGDEFGDLCDPDDDNDGFEDTADNCPFTENPEQEDNDGDGLGNACDDCDCTFLGDVNDDQAINPVDVVIMANFVYRMLGDPPAAVVLCPAVNGDWNCDDQVNPVDIVWLANYVYRQSAPGPCHPCE